MTVYILQRDDWANDISFSAHKTLNGAIEHAEEDAGTTLTFMRVSDDTWKTGPIRIPPRNELRKYTVHETEVLC